MIRRPPRSTPKPSSAASDVYKRQLLECGVILIDKPSGPSSHQLAAWARSLLGINRIGHGGTLDPFATGLLTLLCGRSTKITGELLKKPKSYVAVIRFKRPIEGGELLGLVSQMKGEIYNVPPKESAVKIQVRTRELTKSDLLQTCLLYTSPSPRDGLLSRMPSSA